MSFEKQMDAWNAGARGGLYFGSSSGEAAAYDAGQNARYASGGGPGGGVGGSAGGLLLLPFVFLAPVAFVAGTCLYPLPGILALFGIAMIGEILGDGVGGLAMLVVAVVAGFVFFIGGLVLERRLETYALYRRIRHVMRLIVVAFVANGIVFSFRGAGRFDPNTSFLDRLSVLHVVLVLAAVVAAHFGFRAAEGKYGATAGEFFGRFRLRRKAAETGKPASA